MSMNRRALSVIVVAAIAALSCSTHGTQPPQANVPAPAPKQTAGGPCSDVANRNAPIVCVAVEGGIAVPKLDPVHVFPHTKTNGATTIHWNTSDPAADLQVQMKDAGQTCVKHLSCSHNGNNCVATIDAGAQPATQCRYSVWIQGQTQPQDPIIIIDTCCD